jgi:hypothetical protein
VSLAFTHQTRPTDAQTAGCSPMTARHILDLRERHLVARGVNHLNHRYTAAKENR